MPKTLTKNSILATGDKAPDFEAFDQDGKKVSLKQFKGKTVILNF